VQLAPSESGSCSFLQAEQALQGSALPGRGSPLPVPLALSHGRKVRSVQSTGAEAGPGACVGQNQQNVGVVAKGEVAARTSPGTEKGARPWPCCMAEGW